MKAARIFTAILFSALGFSFLASTILLVYEFQALDWFAMIAVHSHVFLFFPIFGVVMLICFYLPTLVLADIYWKHVRFGKLRFLFSALFLVLITYGVVKYSDERPPIWVASPFALLADQADPPAGRVSLLEAFGELRRVAQNRLGLSPFAPICVVDHLREQPKELLVERYCFPAMKNLPGIQCCRVQSSIESAIRRLQATPDTRSLSSIYEVFLFQPLRVFSVLMIFATAILLVLRRNLIDQHYGELVPAIERGIVMGGLPMLLLLGMTFGYQQTSDVLFGRTSEVGTSAHLLLVLPWILLLIFCFLRHLPMTVELGVQMTSVAILTVGFVRFELWRDLVVRLLGVGMDLWSAIALILVALTLVGRFVGSSKTRWPASPVAQERVSETER